MLLPMMYWQKAIYQFEVVLSLIPENGIPELQFFFFQTYEGAEKKINDIVHDGILPPYIFGTVKLIKL